MGLLLIVLALLFSLLIAILAAANHQLVIVNYIFGEAKLPLIVLIIGAAAAGAVVTGLIGFYRSIRTALQIRGEKNGRRSCRGAWRSWSRRKHLCSRNWSTCRRRQSLRN